MTPNADPSELEKFGQLAQQWWDPDGPLRTLHALNPLRVGYIAGRVPISGARVIDIGCGGGILAEGLAREGARVLGIDLAADSLEVARNHADGEGLSLEYRQASADEIAASSPGSFDVVTCLEVLEHVPDPHALIQSCARLVRPGGSIFMSTINRNPKSFLFAIVGAEYLLGLVPRGTHEYLKLLRPSEVAESCRAAALDVDAVTGLHFNPATGRYWLGGNVDVNYFVHATRQSPS